MKNIRIIIAVVVIIGILFGGYLWLNQGKPKYTGPVKKITLAAYAGETGALVYIAEDQGFFEENGLEVTIKDYESGKAATDALMNREADIATSADFVFISNSFDNTDLRVLGTVSTAEVKELVARKDKGITTIDDLIGKKIGVTKKSGGEFALGRFLILNALSYKNVDLVDLKPSEIVEAVLNGDIDAGFTWDPNVYDIKEQLGNNVISWSGGQDFYFVLLTKEDWIENNSAAAEDFIKSVLEAEVYVKDHPIEAKKFVKNRFNYESDYIDYSWSKQEFVVILEQAMLITFENQARWRIKHRLTEATEVPNYLDYIYLDALEKVKPEAVGIIH
ncbi:MAG: NrtA/SsuA/CpmA family ABC transporter substrate-binding protein [Candidatus Cloacimonetes bacterium]|nr:NrtA/SsuA/CpmA family ABC transporter substrate-binding protein [Candidatus Cloacimonadota bacterium]